MLGGGVEFEPQNPQTFTALNPKALDLKARGVPFRLTPRDELVPFLELGFRV